MKILGLSSSHDAGAAMIENGRILSAINEERLNREKLFWGMPRLSIPAVMENSNTKPEEIDYVAIAGITPSAGPSEIRTGDFRYVSSKKRMMTVFAKTRIPATDSFKTIFRLVMKRMRREKMLIEYIKSLGIDCPVQFVEHHVAHAASAYYTSPFRDPLIITTDAAGDGISSLVCTATKDCGITRQSETSFYHSPGKIYSYVTYNLGFRTGRHEGKITGLAAYGDSSKTLPIFNRLIQVDSKRLRFRSRMGCWGGPAALKVHQLTWGYKREDIAAGVQRMLEKRATELAAEAVKRFGRSQIVLAGGVYANVRVNQKISEIEGVDSVFIHPHMGDGGLAVGSALHLWSQLMLDQGKTPKPTPIDNVYFGMEYSNEGIEKALKKAGLKFKESSDVESDIAHYLKDKKIIGRFHGRMEYGPRALGSRSILADATDRSMNDWLNKRLRRCYDEKTEILTKEGWKLIKDISKDEIVATLNPKKNTLEYQKIKEKMSYPFEGEMFKLKNNRIDLLVTPEHNMWIKRKHSKKFEFKNIEKVGRIKTYHYQRTGGIRWNSQKSMPYFVLPETKKGNRKENTPSIKIPIDLWLEFLGYFLAEGWTNNDKKGHFRCSIAQEKTSRYFKDIESCVRRMPFSPLYDKNTFVICSKQLYSYLIRFGKAKEKYIPNELIQLPSEKLRILFEALMKGDGNIRGSGYRYATTSKRLADGMQIIATKLGYSARISIQKGKKKTHSDLYFVRIGRSDVTTVRNSQIAKAAYKGNVYCVTVPNHIIFVRRNGKPVFCGNSEFMPFAPVIMKEHAEEYFNRFKPGETAAQFMTITFDGTKKALNTFKGVMHVDGTARPQTVTEKQNKSYYNVLKNYKELTGMPILVNTSFNMHEEPIIATPEDAIRAFNEGSVDVLAIGDFLVEYQKNRKA